MKTLTSLTLFLIILFAFSLISCEEKEQEREVIKMEVPTEVLQAFTDAYPGATVIEYAEETEGGQKFYEVSCEFEGRKIDAIYKVLIKNFGGK